jgi:outer membrane biosynthesis protein TonB
MARTGTSLDSLRPGRSEIERLGLVLALSLLLHLLTWGGYEAGKKYGWWQQLHWPAWLHHAKKIATPAPPPVVMQEPPLEFVTVAEPSAEAPKNAKYYSSQNSRASNPDADQETGQPKLNGKQTDAPKAEDVPRMDFSKLQPSPPSTPAKSQQQAQPELAMNSGDLTLGKPSPSQTPQAAQPPRPRTLNEARARLPAVQMRQDGGVQNRRLTASFDAKATPFGAYDEAIIEAVQQHWDDLLDSRQFALDRSGKVTLRFHLNYDGTISSMEVLENTVGEMLGYVCQQAIAEPAPFARWPPDMRREIGRNFREITFTFYYY